MQRAVWWIGLFCVACGGSSAPAESAADVDEVPAEAPDADAEAPSGAEPAGESGGVSEAAPESAGEASKDDVQAILQLVLEDEELNPHLRLDRPDRFPLRIAGPLPPGIELTKATKPVEIVDASEGKSKPVIVFTEIDVRGDRASVRYRYDVENVKGACTLEKREGRWVLARSRITVR